MSILAAEFSYQKVEVSPMGGAGVASACTAACTPESLLELRALDRACGLGRCADPGSGVRPDLGLVTPRDRSNSILVGARFVGAHVTYGVQRVLRSGSKEAPPVPLLLTARSADTRAALAHLE